MRYLEPTLAIFVVALGIVVAKQQGTIDDLRWKIATAAVNHKEASLEAQAKCARQAKIAYDAQGFKARDMANYQSHYNARTNKCMMYLESRSFAYKGSSEVGTVFDAFENKDYASYMRSSDGTRTYNEVPPLLCEVKSDAGDKQKCGSQQEFEEVIKRYMEG